MGRNERDQVALQQLVTKRFAMAAGTYGLALMLTWLTVAAGFYQASVQSAVICSALIVLSQLGFFWMFQSGLNLKFKDPSLTELQVTVALIWLTYFLANLGEARGSLLILYLLVLMFAVPLPPKIFMRYAVLAFASFLAVTLTDLLLERLHRPELALLEGAVLLVALVWMCLFVGHIYRLRQRMRQRRVALQAHQDTLRGMMRQLEDLASTDELTGLFNRRHFLRLAETQLNRLRRGHQIGLALIDLDYFKRINDRHGHAAGDRVLQTFAAVSRACLRDGDVLARYGGEEFVLLLPDTDAEQFAGCCERLREAFAQAEPLDSTIARGELSLSIGLSLMEAGDGLDEALQRADEALYRAKRAGRNRCETSWAASDA